jgi:two-component system, sporulation sensor kinase E
MCVNEPYYITESKRICKESGMDPNDIVSPKKFMTNDELDRIRKSYSEILSVVSYFSNKLLDSLKGTPILIVVSDSEGYLLDLVGDATIKSTVETLGIKQGCLFTQEDTGTNVVSLALQQRHPISLIGEDHYHRILFDIACYGAPFHYTDEDHLLGSVCIMMPLPFQNPLYLTMLSQVVDSIERELLLRKQNKRLNIFNQMMLTRSRNGIVITNEKGTIIEFNPFAEEIFSESKISSLGKNILDWKLIGHYFKSVLKNEEKFENEELKFIHSNGDQVVYLFDAHPIYKDERLIGAFGQFRDITYRYLVEEKIRESDKQALAGQIAAGIAHEIRNPLTTVRGYLQLLDEDLDNKTSHIFSSLLIPEIDRANKIITDFLRIAKPCNTVLETIKVQHFLFDYLWNFLKSEALLYNVELNVVLNPETNHLSLLCNREELLQVFLNLFQNSLQAKGENPLSITISTYLVDSHIQFIFSDNGKGIDSASLIHIFDPFYTTKDCGTGLGLSVSRKIVENHKGNIYASSSGNETKFILEFPISD